MSDISGAGLKVTIISPITFPAGFTVTEWATDADPLTIEDLEVSNSEVGVNGDFVSWHRAAVKRLEMNVIPNTESDKNLKILTQANMVEKNKLAIADEITAIVSYPDGTTSTFSGGVIAAGKIANSVTNDGKIRSGNYKFQFAKVV